MLNTFFEGTEYHTPEDSPLNWKEKVTPGNKKGFYRDYLKHVAALVRKVKKGTFSYHEYTLTSWNIFRCIEQHGGRFHMEGLDHLRGDADPAVIVANHMSALETQTLTSLLSPREVAFVVKKSLVSQPFFGHIMRSVYPIPVSRKNPIDDMKVVMEKGKEFLDRGISVVIFPEGTRNQEFKPAAFNSLGVKLALHANVPVIPIALKTDFWGQGKKLKDFGRIHREREIHFKVGEPQVLQGRGKEQHRNIVKFMEENLSSWGVPIIN